MAGSDVSILDLDQVTSVSNNDLFLVVVDPQGNPTTNTITLHNFINSIPLIVNGGGQAVLVQNITSSPTFGTVNCNPLADFVYITTSGSGGLEYVNLPTLPSSNADTISKRLVFVLNSVANTADTVKITVNNSNNNINVTLDSYDFLSPIEFDPRTPNPIMGANSSIPFVWFNTYQTWTVDITNSQNIDFNSVGSDVYISASHANGIAGNIILEGGFSSDNVGGGGIYISSGGSNDSSPPGEVIIQAAEYSGSNSSISGAPTIVSGGTSVVSDGGPVIIQGGQSYNANGGNVYIITGQGDINNGQLFIGNIPSSDPGIANAVWRTSSNNLVFSGYVEPTLSGLTAEYITTAADTIVNCNPNVDITYVTTDGSGSANQIVNLPIKDVTSNTEVIQPRHYIHYYSKPNPYEQVKILTAGANPGFISSEFGGGSFAQHPVTLLQPTDYVTFDQLIRPSDESFVWVYKPYDSGIEFAFVNRAWDSFYIQGTNHDQDSTGVSGGELEFDSGAANGGGGGYITLIAGRDDYGPGGPVYIYGGYSDGNGPGGPITLEAGWSAANIGGNVSITAGYSSNSLAGCVNIIGGVADDLNATAGYVSIHGGDSYGTNDAAKVGIYGGNSFTDASGGHIEIYGGLSPNNGSGGYIGIQGGQAYNGGGGFTVISGGQDTNTGPGGPLYIYGGQSTSGPGGLIHIESGTTSDGSRDGADIAIVTSSSSAGRGGDINLSLGTSNTSTGGSFIVNGGQSNSGDGGQVEIYAGQSSANGGHIYLFGGASTTSGKGGSIQLRGGDTNAANTAGTVSLSGGSGVGAGSTGGAISIIGGDGVSQGGSIGISSGQGADSCGQVTIQSAGSYTLGVPGGDVNIYTGSPSIANTNAGNIRLKAGDASGDNGFGGTVVIQGGTGEVHPGLIELVGGLSTGNNTVGGGIQIQGGNPIGADCSGGNITITGGTATGAGQGGFVYISGGIGTYPGYVIVTNLPTTDPHFVGALWSNSGVLMISAG